MLNSVFKVSAIVLILVLGLSACQKQIKTKESSFEFNVRKVPFSYSKSSFSVCKNRKSKCLALTDIRYALFGRDNAIFCFFYLKGSDTLKPKAFATPGILSLSTGKRVFGKACFESKKIFRLQGKVFPMILKLDKQLIKKDILKIVSKDNNKFYMKNKNRFGTSYHILSCHDGILQYNKDKCLFALYPSVKNTYEISVEESDSVWESTRVKRSFDDCGVIARRSYNEFLSKMPSLPERYKRSRELASYILWSCIVDKGGNYKRPGILMSKNWMHYIWSWDHCFNAMVCSYHLPEMAWDNYMTIFDAQDADGRLPDMVGYARISRKVLKPPIHGWTFQKMMGRMKFTDAQMKKVYVDLTKWTNFWLLHQDSNKNGIPEYNNGCDSGWDNGTEFDINGKSGKWGHFESADLSAYLIIQMDVLHELAKKLGYAEEAFRWKQKSDKLLSLILSNQWNGDKFVTVNTDDHSLNNKNLSLMAFLPIVLGKKLPADIRSKLICSLKNDGYLTKWGLATENINSPLYKDDGYWRGPIWAPSTMIIVDGLNKCGEHELAKEISRRFCNLCSKSGFAENFDAKTGKGLRDLAYTWTASIFLILGHEYLNE